MQSWKGSQTVGGGSRGNNKRTAAGANFPSPKDPRIEDDDMMSDDDAADGDGDDGDSGVGGKGDGQRISLSQAVLRPILCGPWAR